MAGKIYPDWRQEQKTTAVLPSMDCGLISRQHLTVYGDGTAIHPPASPRRHHRDGAPDNLRHFPDPNAAWGWDSDLDKYYDVPRGTDANGNIYKHRTATKRINNRILNDYGLHRMFIHTKEHYSFMTTMTGICIHLDARYKQQMQTAA